MNFSTPSRVLQTIRAGDGAEWERGQNRVNINNAANCVPPLDAELAKKMGIKINVNWGELMILLAHARRQYRTAWYSSQHFFKVFMPLAPSHHQSEWSAFVTEQINRPMRKCRKHFEALESMFAAVVTHGIAPRLWYDKECWCPDFIAIEDIRIPTDTTLDMENTSWFAVRHIYTPKELLDQAFKDGSRWDKKTVANMLKNKKELNWDYPADHYDWDTQPEKFAELVKQDNGWYASDAMPGFPLWHFYFEDCTDKNNKGWFMRIVPAEGTMGASNTDFMWTSQKPVADKLSHLLHLQFGDLSNKAPFLVWSVRSLGFALLEPTFYTNLTRCRMLQHVHDNFNVWLRSADPADRARAQMQEFGNYGIIKPGLSIVPQTERHQIQADLVEMAMAQLKQLQNEASSTYTQQADTGTKKEQTAFETSVKMEQVNALLSGLLIKSFMYESFYYQEVCRRFCIPDSKDPDVKKFQSRCEKAGIGREWLDVDLWDVEPVTPLGMGNPTLARAAAKELMEVLPLLDGEAQQEAKHDIVLTVTGDSRKAARWVPLGKGRGITDAGRDAQSMFGTLMQAVEIQPREGLPAIEQVEALMPLLAGKITLFTKRDNMASLEEGMGLQTVVKYVDTLIQRIAQNPQEKQRVKVYSDDLGNLNNEIKGLQQRWAQAQKKAAAQGQNGGDPAAAAKIESMMMQAAAKAKATEIKAKQNQKHKAESFVREQRRQDANTFAQIQRDQEANKIKLEAAKATAKAKSKSKSSEE